MAGEAAGEPGHVCDPGVGDDQLRVREALDETPEVGRVVCGARATRGERLEAPWVDERMGETAAILLVTGGHYFSNDPRTGTRTLSVPHCASCRGGASISCPDKRSLVVGFRSYVYWRKFTELNGLRRPRVTARS